MAEVVSNAYGKSRVRVTKLTRSNGRIDVKQLNVDVQLEGDLATTYVTGDSRRIIATDSIKNTVYAFASDHALLDIESYGIALAQHFIHRYAHINKATVDIAEDLWRRVVNATTGETHPTSFVGGSNEKRTTLVVARRCAKNPLEVTSGLIGLQVLFAANSEFFDFIRDEFTTLPNVFDRILATTITLRWKFKNPAAITTAGFNGTYASARATMIATAANHHSLSVQQTQYEAGKAILATCPTIDVVSMSMPNQHHIPFDLSRVGGRPNKNEIFTPTDEPHGLIHLSVRRPASAATKQASKL